MKNLADPDIAKWRDAEGDRLYNTQPEDREWGGAFLIYRLDPIGRKNWLRVIASRGDPDAADEAYKWDHVSVSLPDRCPTWDEMEFIKRLFFKRDETAFQLHVPTRRHISNHDFCLHIWRHVSREIPTPPDDLVGIANLRK
jgi:hypothetical protein